MSDFSHHFINGQWQAPARRKYFETIDPSNRTPIATVARGDHQDIDAAVDAAQQAFNTGPWPQITGVQRAAAMRRVAELIRDNVNELARLEVRDNGKPLPEAVWDIEDTAGCFDYYASAAERFPEDFEENIPLQGEQFTSRSITEPIGVVAAITPWNFPMLMASWKVAPAIASGCTVVLKPSENTPLTALRLAALCDEAGIPPGVLNVVTGYGPEAGKPLVEDSRVDKIAFTGSGPTGQALMHAAADDIKNITLELGGKSPLIIFDDVAIDAAVEWLMFGIYWNKGEVCSATSRVLIHERIYDQVVERLVQASRHVTIGHGFEKGVLLGPLAGKAQFEKVTRAINQAKADGARLVYGGNTPSGLEHGYYVEPTVFDQVPVDSALWTEEVFGPVVALRSFSDEGEALAIANDSRYGLGGAVMSDDTDRCERVARGLKAGIVWVNCSQPTLVEAPWGGYKHSGIGRELGMAGFKNYLQTKQITSYVSTQPWGWYLP